MLSPSHTVQNGTSLKPNLNVVTEKNHAWKHICISWKISDVKRDKRYEGTWNEWGFWVRYSKKQDIRQQNLEKKVASRNAIF